MRKADRISCPSAMCRPDVKLLGIVGRDGLVSILEESIPIDSEFIKLASQGRSPEKRFRFTTTCIAKGCKQWKNGRCGVGDEVVAALSDPSFSQKSLPKCGIRESCRWYLQSGSEACFVCPQVITNTSL